MSPLNNKSNNGKTYWRSLDELEGSAEFQEYLHREFPEGASELNDPFSRRGFMKVMAASFALAGGLTGCRRPEEKILPYTEAPEDVVPGKAYYVATSAPRSRGSLGLLVKSNAGRPTKIEGLPGHPANDGSTDSMAQADLLDLYNPFRQKTVDKNGEPSVSFKDGMNNDFRMGAKKELAAFSKKLEELAKKYNGKGKGLSFLSTPVSSPTQLKAMDAVAAKFPEAKWHSWEPINSDNEAAAIKAFLGTKNYDNQLVYDLSKAKTILTLDSDFMLNGRNSVKMLEDYANRRRVYANAESDKVENANELRFYAVESSFSLTGSNADHRLRLQSNQILDFLFQLASKVSANVNPAVKSIIEGFKSKGDYGHLDTKKTGMDFLDAAAKDLAKGDCAIIVGEGQPVETHLLALVLNQALGSIGRTVKITEKAAKAYTRNDDNLVSESIQLLSNDMRDGSVETLIILDGNPVYNAPSELKFSESLKKVKEVITLTYFPNETSVASTYSVPKTHYLESWGDTRAFDGTVSFIQPLIAPLFSSLTETEFLNKLAGVAKKGSALVRETHGLSSKTEWEKNLQQGYLKNSALTPVASVTPNWASIGAALKAIKPAKTGSFELVFVPDYSTFDGSYSNNGWMQELPDPISKLVWDNAALISYTTANTLGVKARDYITVSTGKGEPITAPCWIVPGMADNTVQLSLGYGRTELGEEKGDRCYVEFADRGYNAYTLRTKESQWFTACEVSKAGGSASTSELVTTQDHWAMEGRDFVKEANMDDLAGSVKNTVAEYYADHYDPRSPDKMFSDRIEFTEAKYQWAMVIDLNSCVGCSACTVACQAENNIPVVGKERVSEGREMHWIRMDRYFFSQADSEVHSDIKNHDLEVGALHQPIPCMQCEDAPCEQVCPVAATQHSAEGLNDMVYNRCIGTRYCLNNCPYKVRRFNYFNFQEDFKDKRFEVNKMVHNPGVTVRSRGVMEKCTYCVQRINEAKIDAKVRKDETIIDSFTTACAQVCPTKAITFGNKNSETTEVVKMRKEARNYTLLPHLNIRPRTSFLGKVTNQNPALVTKKEKGGH